MYNQLIVIIFKCQPIWYWRHICWCYLRNARSTSNCRWFYKIGLLYSRSCILSSLFFRCLSQYHPSLLLLFSSIFTYPTLPLFLSSVASLAQAVSFFSSRFLSSSFKEWATSLSFSTPHPTLPADYFRLMRCPPITKSPFLFLNLIYMEHCHRFPQPIFLILTPSTCTESIKTHN